MYSNCLAREMLRRNLSDADQWSVKVPVPQPSIIQIVCVRLVWTKQHKKRQKSDNQGSAKVSMIVVVDSHKCCVSSEETIRFPEIKIPATNLS
jgi:hypothetical protein